MSLTPPKNNELGEEALKKNLIEVLQSLTQNSQDSQIKKAYAAVASSAQLQDGLQKVMELDPEGFYHQVTYPALELTRGLVALAYPGNRDVQFIFENYAFLRTHTRELIEACEGSSCCADKTRTVCRALVAYFAENKEIVFDLTAKYTFAVPKTVLTSQEEILEWYGALRSLAYGKSKSYLKVLARYPQITKE